MENLENLNLLATSLLRQEKIWSTSLNRSIFHEKKEVSTQFQNINISLIFCCDHNKLYIVPSLLWTVPVILIDSWKLRCSCYWLNYESKSCCSFFLIRAKFKTSNKGYEVFKAGLFIIKKNPQTCCYFD